MERGQDKNGGLAHAGLGLAKHVDSEDRLGNALLLHLGGMFKATVCDGFHQFRLQEEVLEPGGVDTCKLQLVPKGSSRGMRLSFGH